MSPFSAIRPDPRGVKPNFPFSFDGQRTSNPTHQSSTKQLPQSNKSHPLTTLLVRKISSNTRQGEVYENSKKRQKVNHPVISNLRPKESPRRLSVDTSVDEYSDHLYYHGTSKECAKEIRTSGLSLEYSGTGCAKKLELIGREDIQSRKYIYLTNDQLEAAKYARMSGNGEIISLLLSKDLKQKLEQDSEASSDAAFRIKENIPQNCILPSDGISDSEVTSIFVSCGLEPPQGGSEVKKLVQSISPKLSKQLDPLIATQNDFIEEEKSWNLKIVGKITQEQLEIIDGGGVVELSAQDIERLLEGS